MTIKEMRTLTGLSQKKFGEFLYNIPLRSIQNWEYGERECPDYLLKLIEYKLKNEKKL